MAYSTFGCFHVRFYVLAQRHPNLIFLLPRKMVGVNVVQYSGVWMSLSATSSRSSILDCFSVNSPGRMVHCERMVLQYEPDSYNTGCPLIRYILAYGVPWRVSISSSGVGCGSPTDDPRILWQFLMDEYRPSISISHCVLWIMKAHFCAHSSRPCSVQMHTKP